jgi:hypothetical protein
VHFVEANRSSPVIQGCDDGVFHSFFAAHSEDYLFELQGGISQPALPDQTPFLLVSSPLLRRLYHLRAREGNCRSGLSAMTLSSRCWLLCGWRGDC